MNRKVYLLLWLRRWHGRLGVGAGIFFLFLAITGIALNHATQLQLAAYRIHAPGLVRWYGLKVELPTEGFTEKGALLVAANGVWWLNGKIIAETAPPPLGLVESEGVFYIATRENLYIYSGNGQLVEKVSGAALPPLPVLAIGIAHSQLMLQTTSGVFASTASLEWKTATLHGVRWSHVVPLASADQARIAAQLAPGISAETLLLDVHSGRIFGSYGPVVMDIVALILVVLAGSGVAVFLRSHRHHREIPRVRD